MIVELCTNAVYHYFESNSQWEQKVGVTDCAQVATIWNDNTFAKIENIISPIDNNSKHIK